MEMTTNNTSFAHLGYIIAEDIEAYVHLIQYVENGGKFQKRPVNLSVCAATIELTYNQPFVGSSSNQMTKEMAIDLLKDISKPLTG